jgi:IclR family KDG regulon transcriptional repressor
VSLPRPLPGKSSEDSGTGVALARAAEILFLFEPARPARELRDLAEATGIPRPTLLGILNTLVRHDFLLREAESGRYRLGYAWLRLADIRRSQSEIRQSALPVMRQIRDTIDETIILSLKIGDRRVHLDYVESTQPVRRIAHLGHEAPLHVGAAGRVLLAGLSDQDVDSYLARVEGIDAASRAEIRQAVETIRRDGYAIVAGTVNPDTAAVAAPIQAYDGAVVAALTISCPRDRFTARLGEVFARAIVAGARSLSHSLGYSR